MSQSEQIEASKSGRNCRGCGVAEHPAAPFTGGLCDRCCLAVSAVAMKAADGPQTKPAERSGGWSVAQIFGSLLMAVGAFLAIGFLGMTTSVQTGPELGGQRIHNLAMAQQQLIGMLFSLGVFIGGLLIVLFFKKSSPFKEVRDACVISLYLSWFA